MTCSTCHHSTSRCQPDCYPILWCLMHDREATEQCEDFEYEPGTGNDEANRHE